MRERLRTFAAAGLVCRAGSRRTRAASCGGGDEGPEARVTAEIDVDPSPGSAILVAEDAVWVVASTSFDEPGRRRHHHAVVRIDRDGAEVEAVVTVPHQMTALAAGEGSVWATGTDFGPEDELPSGTVLRIDPDTIERPRGWGDWVTLNVVSIANARLMVRTSWRPPDDLTGPERQRALRRALRGDSRENIVEVAGEFHGLVHQRGGRRGIVGHDAGAVQVRQTDQEAAKKARGDPSEREVASNPSPPGRGWRVFEPGEGAGGRLSAGSRNLPLRRTQAIRKSPHPPRRRGTLSRARLRRWERDY